MAKKKKEKKGGKRMKKRELAELLVSYFQLHAEQTFGLKQLFRGLKLTTHPLKMLCVDILEEMIEDGFLAEPEKGEFKLNGKGQILTGTFQRKSNGKNTFTPDEGGTPIFIAERNSAHAMNGDRVRVALCARRKRKAPEGEVIEVLERAKTTFVGTLKVTKNYAFLLTESSTLANDIFIPKEKLKGGKNGDKAVVRITEWPDEAKNPFGEVIDVLGKAGDNTTEMHAILAEYGLPYTYPATVEAAAEKLSAEITPEDYAEREDFRGVTTFTIDPKGSAIDKEAVKRATSVYLVDRTIPMLPERLCNFICSLRPDEEKLAYSVIFNLNDQAEVKDYRIRHTVIKSDRRFTYEEAQAIIETGTGDFNYEILELNRLAQQLRFKESKEANKLIEEFMLLANRTVAEHVGKVPKNKKPKVLPYRIHDLPDPMKLENLNQFIARFGYKIRTGGTKTEVSRSLNRLLSDVSGKKEQNLIETVSLRAMQKARYSIHNIGHYGLAFDYYTHFTSPIRRYPDLMVHRLLTRYEAGGRTAQADKYEELCDHSSAMEQTAASAERASIKDAAITASSA